MNVLITGAGRGLGYQLTEQAVLRGHFVIACVRGGIEASESLQALAREHTDRLRIESLDVTQEEQVSRLNEQLREDSIELSGIINNAGILLGREHKIASLPMQQLRMTLDVNLLGPMIVAKHLSSLLSEHANAKILNISSEAGSFAGAYGGDYAYALSKSALNMFSKQLGDELRPRGVRVLAVHPGWIRTDMGGDNAPNSATDSALGILGLLEGTTPIAEQLFFVDHLGKEMPL
ncbi:MAG: SDR family NAD(P)-dependent oxidoreductase [Candidatus Cohnella colombiensis]|uniref:SDR family NAD(P)-dependent oxidoreductase n=1 Tax=Candidatus Cohnella colombiensis TaxID=3121368 RepID=A0AA95JGD1_9BACL|nr:MAG: SDR family NAD(P)-dependent oxidoreductase [Cohnella sp.]